MRDKARIFVGKNVSWILYPLSKIIKLRARGEICFLVIITRLLIGSLKSLLWVLWASLFNFLSHAVCVTEIEIFPVLLQSVFLRQKKLDSCLKLPVPSIFGVVLIWQKGFPCRCKSFETLIFIMIKRNGYISNINVGYYSYEINCLITVEYCCMLWWTILSFVCDSFSKKYFG